MSEVTRQVILTIVTAAMAAVILTPTFFALKLLLDAGLGVVLASVVVVWLLVAYGLWRESTR